MSYEQGLSGLNSSSIQLDTIGNNVANANTVGFKSSDAQFADMFAAAIGGAQGGGLQVGMGSQVSTIAQQFTREISLPPATRWIPQSTARDSFAWSIRTDR